jgi:two-component system LytT family sensor kinase
MIDAVPLARELDLLDRYTAIQRTRFGDRLDVRVSIEDPAARDALVPILILQPLVENAIRHGIAERARAGRIDVRARRHGGRLVLEVEDDGSGLPPGEAREGVGIGNTKARLAEMYGRNQEFELIGSKSGTVARLSIPWQTDHNPAGEV